MVARLGRVGAGGVHAAAPGGARLSAGGPEALARAAGGLGGRALTEAALDDLRARGYAEAAVWSFAANQRANAFYEAAGFARDGAERTEEAWADLAEVRYRRAL